MNECGLCSTKKTISNDDICSVATCSVCGKMVVFHRKHTVEVSAEDLIHMFVVLMDSVGLDADLSFDQSEFPGHFHFHVV